eukprot:gb/GEZN01000431.1/.p1 GENE.gb/GEZN01000431.1/~~gb/GEZN01000431.1/.p1  ORF type:complete len:1192 (+),score=90.52 gb/GEZN01000431.1/:733-4308(+)
MAGTMRHRGNSNRSDQKQLAAPDPHFEEEPSGDVKASNENSLVIPSKASDNNVALLWFWFVRVPINIVHFLFESLFIVSAIRYKFDFSLDTWWLLFFLHLPLTGLVHLYRYLYWKPSLFKQSWESKAIGCYLITLQWVFFLMTITDSPVLHPKFRQVIRSVFASTSFDVLTIFGLLSLLPVVWKRTQNADFLPVSDKRLAFLMVGMSLVGWARLETSQRHFGCLIRADEYSATPLTPAQYNRTLQYYEHVVSSESGRDSEIKTTAPNATAGRAGYSETSGCLRGTFKAADRVPTHLSHGLFATQGSEFPAWVRFSRRQCDDRVPQFGNVLGMAVKILQVPGPSSAAASAGEPEDFHSHDLLFSSCETLPWRRSDTAGAMLEFWEMSEQVSKRVNFWPAIVYMFPSFNPLHWRLAYAFQLTNWMFALGRHTNHLKTTYWSPAPYRLPGTYVRYQVRPCHGSATSSTSPHYSPNPPITNASPVLALQLALSQDMHPEKNGGGACFELLVQQQTNPCVDHLDDLFFKWNGPWVLVGELNLPPQHFHSAQQMEFCDNLAFSPFQTGTGHEPVGAWAELAKVAYPHGRSRRHALNSVKGYTEPSGKEVFNDPQLILPSVGAGDTTIITRAYPAPFHGLPRHVSPFREDMDFTAKDWARISTDMLSMHSSIEVLFYHRNVTSASLVRPDSYNIFTRNVPWLSKKNVVEEIARRWWTDQEFSRQFLSGINPTQIRRCQSITELTEKSAMAAALADPQILDRLRGVVNETDQLLGQSDSSQLLQTLVTQNRLFYVDYESLDDIYMVAGRLFYSPIVLFYTTLPDRNLRPLAIQLTRFKQSQNKIFTPPKGFSLTSNAEEWESSESSRVWVFAKMHVTCADAMMHQCVTHLALTHLALEPIIVTLRRQLTSTHPITVLLKPHLLGTLAINELGRHSLLAEQLGDFDRVMGTGRLGGLQLMEKAYQRWSLRGSAFPERLRERGVLPSPTNKEDDPLPGYVYRDLMLLYWHAFEDYVTSALETVYLTDKQVQEDQQLQAFVRELYDPRLSNLPGAKMDVQSLQDVIQLVTSLIFIASADHSAVNFGQIDYYNFVPGRPLFMKKLMPADTSRLTLDYVMASLPGYDEVLETIAMAHTLSLPELNPLDQRHAAQESIRDRFPAAHALLSERLQHIAKESDRLSNKSAVPYDYLHPSRVAPSIAI